MIIAATPACWVDAVVADFDGFLGDHASCEKKASGMALSVAAHYRDRPELVLAMADLAVEELSHYREVIRLIDARGARPSPDRKDPYIRALSGHIRRGPELFLLDRLLLAAVVERRGAERFALVADGLAAGRERAFYRAIAASEERHWQTFLDLAKAECPDADVSGRLTELVRIEAGIVAGLPLGPTLH